MNQYALFSLIAVFICIILGVSVYQRASKQPLYTLFLALSVGFSQWALAGFGLAQADSFEEACWWVYLFKMWPVTVAILLHFIVFFVGREDLGRRVYFKALIYGTAALVTVVELSTDLVTGAPILKSWGWTTAIPSTNPVSLTCYTWFFAMCAAILYFAVRYGLLSPDSKHSKQIRLLLFGLSVPFVASIVEACFYLFGERLPPFSPVVSVSLLFVAYGIWKHDLLALSPVRVAHEIVTTMADSLLLIDPKGIIATANRAALDLLGYGDGELTGRPLEMIFIDKDEMRGRLLEMVAESSTETDPFHDLEVSVESKSGVAIPVSLSGAVLRTRRGGPQGLILIGRDISRRKREEQEKQHIEQQLFHGQKIEAIGQLAGGVAHDMNNVLAIIVGEAAVLSDDIASGTASAKQMFETIDSLNAACKRGSDLTRNLLGFARKGAYLKQQFSLNEVALQLKELLAHTAPKQIEIKTRFGEGLHFVLGDRSQIEHALLNICINAMDAISDYGRLTIETDNVVCSVDVDSRFSDIEPGDYVRIRITDTGGGIEPALKDKVFEPFFTTKNRGTGTGTGAGTGLGLAMVYGAIRNHLGTVKLDSVIGLGTSVEVYLPATKSCDRQPEIETKENRISRPSIPAPSAGSSEGVLLVDDEDMIRRSLGRLLKNRGYNIFQARNGVEALALYKEKRTEISLVILDMVMPELDGPGTFRALMEVDPGVKVIIHSGYSKDERVDDLLAAGAKAFVPKPFDPDMLIQMIARV